MAIQPFTWTDKLPVILGRINPIIDRVNTQQVAVENLETVVGEVTLSNAPDLIILFENGLV